MLRMEYVVIVVILFQCEFVENSQILVAQYNELKNYYVAQCGSNDYRDAIAWITPLGDQYTKIETDDSRNEILQQQNKKFSSAGWTLEKSYKSVLGPILDYMWEMFPIKHTQAINAQKRTEFQFTYLGNVNFFSIVDINLSILADRDAQIYLCKTNNIQLSECYWIILGGWGGSKSALRHCDDKYVPTFIGDKRECTDLNKVNISPLSTKEWNHFSIKKYDNEDLQIIHKDKVILSCQISDQMEFDNFNHLYVQSYTSDAFWKLHDYNYLIRRSGSANLEIFDWRILSGHFCISFFAIFKKTITIELRNRNTVISKQNYKYNENNSKWKYFTFNANNLEKDNYLLELIVEDNDEVLVRNFVIHKKCNEYGSGFRFSQLKFQDSSKVSCTSLNKKSSPLKIKDSKNKIMESCPFDTIGAECLSCSDLFNHTECPRKKIICEFDSCYCSPGFTGKFCNNECNTGTYGINCLHQCGACKYNNECSKINGTCLNGCKENYIGPNCKERYLPVLTEVGSIESECIDRCKVVLYNDTLSYEGKVKPNYYYVRLMIGNKIVDFGERKSINNKEIIFENLQKSTAYSFEIVLCFETTQCYGKGLKLFNFETSCKELEEQQINIESKDKCISVTVPINRINCNIQDYYLIIFDMAKEIIFQNYFNNSFNACPFNLKYFTNYSLELNRNNAVMVKKIFLTDEGLPNRVTNIISDSGLPTKLTVRWDEPKPVVGIITNYLVEYTWLNKLECTENDLKGATNRENTTQPFVTLKNLRPYSRYKINIVAFTKKGRGVDSEIHYGTTKFGDKLKLDELNKTIEVSSFFVRIVFNIDCKEWNGPLFGLAIANCTSEWCKGSGKKTIKFLSKTQYYVDITKLLSHTKYSLEIYFQRNENLLNSNPQLYSAENIITKASRPNTIAYLDVYSKTKNSISLRWTEPYPPTGVLDTFLIEYVYYAFSWGYYKRRIKEKVTFQRCDIWKEMFCTTLTNLEENYEYTVSVYAGNKNITSWSNSKGLVTTTKLAIPEAPLNVDASWNETNFLSLQWQHPNRTNGPLEKFDLSIGLNHFQIKPPTQNLTYMYLSNYRCTPENHEIEITLKTVNTQYASYEFRKIFTCPIFEPKLSSQPKLNKIFNNTLSISIPNIKNAEAESSVYIIVINKQKNGECKNEILKEHMKDIDGYDCWIAEKFQSQNLTSRTNKEIIIKLSQMPNYNFNYEDYSINILLMNKFKEETSHSLYTVAMQMETRKDEPIEQSGANYWWLILVFLLIIIIPAIIFIMYKKKEFINGLLFSPVEGQIQPDLIPLRKPAAPASVQHVVTQNLQRNTGNGYSEVVEVSELNTYLKEAIFNGKLEMQHEQFPRGVIKSADCGMEACNILKNRYKNLRAYDHTRVLLEPYEGRTSDYINANYIKSPFSEKAYIATQGPKSTTLTDFWHMIITEGVENIVMLANVVEAGKPKVDKYWPDLRKFKKTITYGDVEVDADQVKTYSNYEVRTFTATRKEIKRTITQYHFTSWPDHGVPMYPQSLIPFVQCILNIKHNEKHPILIHCSAGVGRTGTIILLDICIRLGLRDKRFDAYHQLYLLREQRPNMVDNIEQYKLAHLVIFEYLTMPKTTYPCENFEETIAMIKDEKFQEQMQYIEDTAWQESAINPDLRLAVKIVKEKNRFQEIVPEKYGCLYLRPLKEGDSSYINAVYVDGFNAPKKFIATQHPLANTVDDFWRLIVDNDIKLIVSLQTNYDTNFWTYEGDLSTSSNIQISHLESEEFDGCNLHTLEVQGKGEPKEIKLIETNKWGLDEVVPEDLNALMTTWRQMDKIIWNNSSTIVVCRDGTSACGLFIAMSCLLERIKLEQLCDVCQIVRSIRRSRKQFVTNMVQFKCLYRLAALFLSEFDIYSNFRAPQP